MNNLLYDVLEKVNVCLRRLQLPLLEPGKHPKKEMDAIIFCFSQERVVEIKKSIAMVQFPRLEQQLCSNNAILFTEYISPTLAECLQKSNIEYADLAGNIFLKGDGNCILVQNCAKPKQQEEKVSRGRALAPTGLKVLFLLLTQPEALNWTYRQIGDYAGVSLGSVKYVMSDLLERKWLIEFQEKLHFQNVQDIYERWTNAYIEKICSKYEVRRFKGEFDFKDKQLLDKYPVVVTGETAAAYMKLLKPAKHCLYQWGNLNKLIARNRWLPDDEGNIEIRRAFWPGLREFDFTVPPLLIYADLIAENDGRCMEVARTVYERYLKQEQ